MLDPDKSKERKSDRILVLEIEDNKKALSSVGLTDSRLFKGENKLHAVMDPNNCLWSFKYEVGGLPPVLKQKFTSFGMLLDHAKDYYKSRNILIKEVLD